MSKYDEDPEVRRKIDDINKTINEKIYPTINGTDCTKEEMRIGLKQEKYLRAEIRELDLEYYLSTA